MLTEQKQQKMYLIYFSDSMKQWICFYLKILCKYLFSTVFLKQRHDKGFCYWDEKQPPGILPLSYIRMNLTKQSIFSLNSRTVQQNEQTNMPAQVFRFLHTAAGIFSSSAVWATPRGFFSPIPCMILLQPWLDTCDWLETPAGFTWLTGEKQRSSWVLKRNKDWVLWVREAKRRSPGIWFPITVWNKLGLAHLIS